MKITLYNDNLEVVSSLQKLIDKKYKHLFLAVIVHGSVATNEVIAFSDFDGFIIVKDRFVGSKKLKQFKKESMKLILKFDPLQHHGWFQIKESQLLDYPESYLPMAVLEKAKTIYPLTEEIDLKIEVNHLPDYRTNLFNMISQLENKVINKWRPKNLFQLKSLLSQIMLVPCLFYSGKFEKGIFKRKSFEAVRDSFTHQEWSVIETATQIRKEWNPQLNSLQKTMLNVPHRLFRKAVVKFIPMRIPKKHLNLIGDDFYEALFSLTQKIKREI